MKHVRFNPPSHITIIDVLRWCRDNNIPAVAVSRPIPEELGARTLSSKEAAVTRFWYMSNFANFVDIARRRICVREQDAVMVKIRFPELT